jgi:hypothetical protein
MAVADFVGFVATVLRSPPDLDLVLVSIVESIAVFAAMSSVLAIAVEADSELLGIATKEELRKLVEVDFLLPLRIGRPMLRTELLRIGPGCRRIDSLLLRNQVLRIAQRWHLVDLDVDPPK